MESSHERTWSLAARTKTHYIALSEDATWLDNNVLLLKVCVVSGCSLLKSQ